MVSADFADRPVKKLILFDVDGTLSLARQVRTNRLAIYVSDHSRHHIARVTRDDCTFA